MRHGGPARRRLGGWRLAGLLRPHAPRLAAIVLLLVLLAFANMALPFSIKLLVDDVFPSASKPGRWSLVWLILPGLGVVYLLRNVLFFSSRMLAVHVAEEVCFRLRSRLYEHLQRMSIAFYREERLGRLSSRLMDDTHAIRLFVQDRLPALLLNSIMLVTLLVIVYAVDWELAVVSSLVLPLHFLTYRHFVGPIRQSYARAQESIAAAHGSLVERFLGIDVVKSFNAERRERARFDSTIEAARRSYVTSLRHHFAQKVTADLLIGAATLGLLGFGAWHVTQGVMTTGAFLMFFGYVMMLYPTVLELLNGSSHLARAGASAERVFDLLERPDVEAGVLDESPREPAPPVRGEIEFRDVDFAYDGGPPVLAGVSFTIGAGEHVALVGPSGAGKTTLASLIPLFNRPTRGRVLVDGRDVTTWPLSELRAAIAIAFQEAFLFNTSILENVLYGRYDATVHEIVEACKATGAHDFIDRLPVGYGSTPSERGGRFSRGEKQRITLARAILKDAPILILDEATASLDPAAGTAIMRRVLEIMRGRTVLLITHDAELARLADRVINVGAGGA